LKLSLRSLETHGFAILSGLVAYGYSFTRANTYNQMPAISALFDNNLFSQDFYIQEMTQFTARFYYYHLMLFFHQLGLSLPVVSFGLFVLAFSSMVLGLCAMGTYLGRSGFAGVALAFLALAVEDSTLGKTDIFRTEPIAAIYAMGIAVWGIYFCCRRRWRLGYLMFGLACLLQFLIGLLPACLWGVPFALDALRQRRPLKLLMPCLIFGVFASLVYVPMVLTGNTSSSGLSDSAFVHLYGDIRHPHHIIVSSFPAEYWRSFLSLTGAGLICLRLSTTLSSAQKRHLVLAIAAACGLVLVGYVFVEQVPIALVAKLQFARTTPFALIAALAGVGVVASEYHHRGNHPVSLLLIALPIVDRAGPVLLLMLTGLLWLARRYAPSPPQPSLKPLLKPFLNPLVGLEKLKLSAQRDIAIAYALFLIVLLACWAYLPVLFASLAYPLLRRPFPNFFHRSRLLARAGLAGLVLYLGLQLSGTVAHSRLTPLHRKIKLYTQQDEALKVVAARFRQNSPTNALVLVPPADIGFRYFSERSVVVTFKSFPFTDRGILIWQDRIERILGPLDPEMIAPSYSDELYSQHSAQELVAIAQDYQADYILTRHSWHPDMAGTVVAEVGDWAVWHLP
ncbi:MAG: DUF6798 domain-containing protein, partial [Cyanobacteria bacterium P01_D01_bin.44]